MCSRCIGAGKRLVEDSDDPNLQMTENGDDRFSTSFDVLENVCQRVYLMKRNGFTVEIFTKL